jgi:hypothetical protein
MTFACDRQALSAEQRKRHFEILLPKLRSVKKSVQELADGYEFGLPGDAATLALVSEWVEGERRCCPFFEIDVESDAEAGALRVRLTGPQDAKQFIRSELFQLFDPE